jgi:hypothetical protein
MDINLNNVESDLNKSTNVNTDQASNTKYPSVKAVFDWAVGLFVQKNAPITGATKTKITYDANGLVTSGADATINDLGYFHLDFTPSSVVTGTTSPTQVGVVTIPANSIKTIDNISIYTIISKVANNLGTVEVRLKLSTSATMPSGTDDMIGRYNIPTNTRFSPVIRMSMYSSGNLTIFRTDVSANNDLSTSQSAPNVIAYDRTVDLHLYVEVTLSNASDEVSLIGGHIKNT